ncbi:hypothetical protein SAMN04489740_0970 [Arthrobacter alpinus]|uniref:Uncharacterized protein n=1 Tax=Arthrobacter alpinus TaxID=656366 RepID=A0A1H5HB31_9MICC|nr:hypothetical protein [Arthrobacter alpinus]SEE25065.1 hypothetical protein SAMN04489740_0970 [Arthrobacter alpinus]
MNDSPRPSAPAGNSGTAVEVEIPVDMFFDARDYAPVATAGAKPKKDQGNVSLARSRRLTAIHKKLDQLTIALKHLRTADAVGLVTQSMDVLVGITDQFHKQVHDLAKQADNAELRYEEYFETPPLVPPAADVPPASAAGASTQSVVTVVVAPKVRGLNHPSSMAEAISMRSQALAANPALAAQIARASAAARMEQR